MTQKSYPQNLYTQKNIYFSETPQTIEIQNFKPPKIARAYVCMKISEYPSPILGFKCLTLLKIEVIEYGKKGF